MKLNKNLVGNIVIMVSILLVLSCFALIMISGPMGIETVKWEGDGYTYILTSDMKYQMDENTFNVTSPYEPNNYMMKKTNDQTNFRKYFKNSLTDAYSTPRNLTHTILVNGQENFAVIVPTESFKTTDRGYELNGTPEIIEIQMKDSSGIASFILGSTR